MKFRKEKETYETTHTNNGIPEVIERERDVLVPVLPRDWDVIVIRVAIVFVLALTLVAVVWSTWSIGELLGGGIGYAAATVFDISWATCLLMEWLARYQPAKRRFPKVLGWVLVVVTMAAIGAHGMRLNLPEMAVVGAAVSGVAKILWLGVMRHVERDLSEEDRAWVEKRLSRANALQAVSSAERSAARVQQHAVLEQLAQARDARRLADSLGIDPATLARAMMEEQSKDEGSSTSAQLGAAARELLHADEQSAPVPAPREERQQGELAEEHGRAEEEPAEEGADEDEEEDEHQDEHQDEEEEEVLPDLEPPILAALPKSEAIRIAIKRRPNYNNPQIAEILAGYDVHVDANFVGKVRRGRKKSADQEQAKQEPTREVVPFRKHG